MAGSPREKGSESKSGIKRGVRVRTSCRIYLPSGTQAIQGIE
jgi:hypothetical protein